MLCRYRQVDFTYRYKGKGIVVDKKQFEKCYKVGGLTMPYFKTYYKNIVLKAM